VLAARLHTTFADAAGNLTGYEAVSHRYRGDNDTPAEHVAWLRTLQQRLPANANVLDLGCGCGVPVAKTLTEGGHRVTGVDISQLQINRARQLVPNATFLHADATQITFPEDAADRRAGPRFGRYVGDGKCASTAHSPTKISRLRRPLAQTSRYPLSPPAHPAMISVR
jgi:SAM-dependent methyltransferase